MRYDIFIEQDYLVEILAKLLATPSPTGMTDEIVGLVCEELKDLDIPFELTRRGAIRADLKGAEASPDRAIAAHLDTLGAMVKSFRLGGRLEVIPIGHWSSRFAEGARCTVHSDGGRTFRGTILPAKASGHTYNEEIDTDFLGQQAEDAYCLGYWYATCADLFDYYNNVYYGGAYAYILDYYFGTYQWTPSASGVPVARRRVAKR